ncbi:tetratricopeptide repeat protein [Dyella dinghuensis]|nr:hypothetical protein [Dyella dinghuensis]
MVTYPSAPIAFAGEKCLIWINQGKGAIMTTRVKWLLVCFAVLCLTALYSFRDFAPVRVIGTKLSLGAQPEPLMVQVARDFPSSTAHIFSDAELRTFVVAASKAEAIDDPLQRCLAYPDPPGSHWTHAAVVAYCQYRTAPYITFDQVKALIEQGKSAELDREMADALKAQYTAPYAYGRLERIFAADFDNGSLDIRPILDAWKRNSPNSAFAYAASGYAYVAMAHDARGGDYINRTSQDKVDAMGRLLQRADTDLQKAISIEPRITPVYAAMIHAGGLELGNDYAVNAAQQGLRQDPGSWIIYRELLWLSTPQWGGSLALLHRISADAAAHSATNPLLAMEKNTTLVYEANVGNCDCGLPTLPYEFPYVLDELASSTVLAAAGRTGWQQNMPSIAVVYLSEALRFAPGMADARFQRVGALADAGVTDTALRQINQLMAVDSRNYDDYQQRAYIYLLQHDYANAEKDLDTMLTLKPADRWSLEQLASMYINQTHQWDKGWDVAGQLMQDVPDDPEGWVFRATIAQQQPRDGLAETVNDAIAHFGNDPRQRGVLARLKRMLTTGAKPTVSSGGASSATR